MRLRAKTAGSISMGCWEGGKAGGESGGVREGGKPGQKQKMKKVLHSVEKGVYPTFYMAVASNTAYDITTVLLDLFRITGRSEYREAAGAMIAQFFDHADSRGRPAYGFAGGKWVMGHGEYKPEDVLGPALGGSNELLVRMAEKYRASTGEDRFDAALLRNDFTNGFLLRKEIGET